MSLADDQTSTLPSARAASFTPARAPAADARIYASGTRIHQYDIIRELGRGGMGQVFLARDTRLARRVALKFLTTGSAGRVDQFLAEARATAQCTHENIVVIHEVAEHEGTPYMVLEYLEGGTLRKVMARGRVSAGRAIELVLPVVRALVCAHAFDIVHRDLKPENVFVTAAGAIKVLDFGIAKLLARDDGHGDERTEDFDLAHGAMTGTVPYMSPEQFGVDAIDHRADLWAIGIVLFELVTGTHPYAPVSAATLFAYLSELDRPVPSIPRELEVPEPLRRVIARCLAKRKAERYASARELCAELEALLPERTGRRLADDESPFPGLAAFQEADADRFFGRTHDAARVAARLRDHALVGILGPSGIGKSSLVRAGVIPALKVSGEQWRVLVARPGRTPLASLANLVSADLAGSGEVAAARLAREPGALGTALRAWTARERTKLLLFVDQFEELYTLGADDAQRRAFVDCLAGVADETNGPLRVVIAMRSDFLDRVGESPGFLDELTPGIVFLQPLAAGGLRDALVRPLDARGYAFEAPSVVDQMVDDLASTPGALPLLQFAASRLWETRDRPRKWITQASHVAMGGVAGALATHADQVLASLALPAQRLAQRVFQRLVTPERTRAIVERDELRGLALDAQHSIDVLIDLLVANRLLVVQTLEDGAGSTIELVHESLIGGWPKLRRWLDEGQDDAAYIAQVRTAAKQWDQRGRAHGLLWRGEAEREAREFRRRRRGELAAREEAFLDAVIQLGSRAARIRRGVMFGSFALLAIIAIGSAIALLRIRDASQAAEAQAARAESEKLHAEGETLRAQDEAAHARTAEAQVQNQLDQIRSAQAARDRAESDSRTNLEDAQMSRKQLQEALVKAERAKAVAEDESRKAREAEARAQAAAADERVTREQAEALYQREKTRAQQLEARGKQITNKLP